jgi:predicted kinase
LAKRWAVPFVFLLCQAESETVRQRLRDRQGDVSDADWAVYQHMAQHWQPLEPLLEPYTISIRTDRPSTQVQEDIQRILQKLSLY